MTEPITILIVEDEDDHYELIQRSFADKLDRYCLYRATNIRQARQGYSTFAPTLIITDWKLPDGDGIELIEKDAAGNCRYPVILMTSHGNEAWAVEAMKLGALDYFVKSPEAFAEVPRLAQRAINEWTNTAKRQKAEEALQRSEDLFRALFENASDGILHLSAHGDIVSLNASFARMHGYTVDEMLQMGLSDLALPGKAQLEAARLQKVLTGEPLIYEVEHYCKNGQTIPLEVSANGIDVSGDKHILGFYRDISERKRTEAELAKSRQDWEDIFQAIGQPAMLLSLEHDILSVNEATVRVAGRKASELISRKCYEVFHADQGSIPPACCPLVTMQQSQQTHVEEMEVNAMGGRFLVSCTPVFDQAGKVTKVIHIAVDITEKQRLTDQLHQAQKMESIGTLAGGIAHDFNNILSAIVGYTDLALLKTQENNSVHDDLRQVRKAADRATDLVRQILTFSRKQQQEKMPIQISMVIKEALKLLRASIPTTIEIRQEIISEATVMADPTQVHQMIMNLCTNAYHAMMEGGVLGVTLKEVAFDQAITDLDTELPPGRYVSLSISDTGCGMDKETMTKIFDPYFTTKGRGKGTGLGLAVVHGIVKSHNGRIAVYSEPGRGTTFNVYLPMIVHEAAFEAVALPPPMARAHERVMLVDDEDAIRDLASQFLLQAGYRVDAFANGLEAWLALSQAPNDWDLIVTDQTMPQMTGYQLASKVLALRPDLPIILCSGYSTIVNSDQAKEVQVSACLQKPVSRNELLSQVFQALAKKAAANEGTQSE